MNNVTQDAYQFFMKDEEAYKALSKLLESGETGQVISSKMREYVSQLNKFMLIAIYSRLEIDVVDATDWDELANRAICDWYGAHTDNNT
jgi:hypothetical protein